MTPAVVIALDEIRVRRMVLVAAAAAAVLALAIPLSPTVSAEDAADAVVATSLLLAWWVPLVLAIHLGANLVARDLAEDRLAFWLVRPVGAWSLWLGRLGASVALLLVSQLVILLPALVVPLGGDATILISGAPLGLPSLLLLPLPLLIASHVAAVAVRGRSRWALVDVGGLLVAVTLAWSALKPLVHLAPVARVAGFGFVALWVVATIVAAGAFVAGVVGGGVQLQWGRSDVRRSHRALSLTVWPALAVITAVALGVSAWARATPPGSLRAASEGAVGPHGRWMEVRGVGRLGTPAAYLVDTMEDRWIELPAGVVSPHTAFASAGPVAAWTTPVERSLQLQRVVTADLDTLHVAPSGLGLMHQVSELALSPDGRRLAVLAGETLTTIDLATQERASARFDGGLSLGLFVDRRVRLYRAVAESTDTMRVDILEMDAGALERTGGFDVGLPIRIAPDPELRRLVVAGPGDEWIVVDARTGALLEVVGGQEIASARPLSDGRLATVRIAGHRATLTFGDLSNVDLGAAQNAVLAGEVGASLLVVLWRGPFESSSGIVISVDTRTGRVTQVDTGLFPIPWDLAYGWRIGHAAGGLLVDGEGGVFRWLPAEQRVVPALPG